MKKIAILLIVLMIVGVAFLIGCTEQNDTNINNSNLPEGDQNNTSQPSEENPDPYFPSKNSREGYTYAPDGTITSIIIGKEVKNRGKAGEVFVSVTCAERGLYASKVFYLDENENVTVEAHINSRVGPHEILKWDWTARAALPDDTSQGEVYIEKPN